MVGLRGRRQQLTEVVEQLVVRHPSPIRGHGRQKWFKDLAQGKFGGARIREFVPLFVNDMQNSPDKCPSTTTPMASAHEQFARRRY